MNILDIINYKKQNKKMAMITCYDFWSARIIENSPIELVLVGDSAANIIHGHPTTLPIDTKTMALHVAAVAKGLKTKFIVGDMPFLSTRKSLTHNMKQIEIIMKAGAHSIKIEGAEGNLELIRHCVNSGIPVMGHLGLTPQSFYQMGGFKVQGRTESAAQKILEHSLSLQQAGCFSIVLECVPSSLAREITSRLEIPTIGIGAGPDVDGQVLVFHDLLGLNDGFHPKFLRKFLDGKSLIKNALEDFHQSVQNQSFPSLEESYE